MRDPLGKPARLFRSLPAGGSLRRSLRSRQQHLYLRWRHGLARHDAEPDRPGFRREPRQPRLRTAIDRPRAQPQRPSAPAAARPPWRAEQQGSVDHRIDGRQSCRAAVAARYRRRRRSVAPAGGTPLPPGNGPLARPLLP
ncbi:hypothetical protein N5K21_08745 [Rhizobium pusense]|nr:hypothetical protein [Agrobacterium pusense]MDH1266806.1 hypothetical protein [Agrobacterium pusense]MDH2088806.1 hypothetical protein [Agrobacterium pusense]